jgi:hypothetical protein
MNYAICRFSFGDGLISEICPSGNETSWVLNFKRGILSAFQNTMKRFDVDHWSTDVRYSYTYPLAHATLLFRFNIACHRISLHKKHMKLPFSLNNFFALVSQLMKK